MKILVTAALPYVNNEPHLGNLIPTLSAEVYSRFKKSKGEECIYVCGTDEHGTTTEVLAEKEKLTPKQVCDKYFRIHKKIYEWLNIDFDAFGRTSDKVNYEQTQDIFLKLYKHGYILEKATKQFYCSNCKRFLADRFVEGVCPKCGYEHARGDQCPKCGSLLDSSSLKSPKCKICGTEPRLKETKHLYIDLKKLQPKIAKWVNTVKDNWTENARNETVGFLKQGLKPRSITRDLKWGIPVPLKKWEDKVFYSWFDAPIGYISITRKKFKNWKDWWLNPKETKLVQFMGKDNTVFHTIMFPGFLIGTGDNYTLVNTLSINEFLNYEGGKFSKSDKRGVFGNNMIETDIHPDIWRYYLMRIRPEKNDTEFTWEDFQDKLNNELVGNIGNLVNRILVFINRYFEGIVPKANLTREDNEFWRKIRKLEEEVSILLEKIELKEALSKILEISSEGNTYFQIHEPWKNEKCRGRVLYMLINLLKDLAILLEPYMPKISEEIFHMIGIKKRRWDDLGSLSVKAGTKLKDTKVLFKKLSDEEVKKFKEKYGSK